MYRSWIAVAVLLFLVNAACPASDNRAQRSVESIVTDRNLEGQAVPSERDEQEALFNYYFKDRDLTYETRLSQLKTEATVPAWRIPYSASIHPQSAGGLSDASGRGLFSRSGGHSALAVYDIAFNGGRGLANGYEVRRVMGGTDRALFPRLRLRSHNDGWEGYCSGFTAATIRHPEPVNAVDAGDIGGRSGIVIQPADIKALLSCIYNRTTDDSFFYVAPPSANDGGPNMATFHLALTNYIGRAGYPIGINRTKGTEAWNNPVYAYKVELSDESEANGLHLRNVETTITYTAYGSDDVCRTDEETGERQNNRAGEMTFRYTLALDETGRIVGGAARSNSGHFLWLPLYAVQAEIGGSAPGNPYIDVDKVLALARAASLPDIQEHFDEAVVGRQPEPSADVADTGAGAQ